jgi:DNA-binding response OmpR family regulator
MVPVSADSPHGMAKGGRGMQSDANPAGPAGAGRHVLLIEDEANIAEAIRFILMRDGWTVSLLADGVGATDRVRAMQPDLVILDLMLPGASGLDILGALRADPATAAMPVLMLTARGQTRDREAAARAGASGFMAKPFSNAEMLAQVRALVAT